MISVTLSSGQTVQEPAEGLINMIITMHLTVHDNADPTKLNILTAGRWTVYLLHFPSTLSVAVFLSMLNEARARQKENRPF